MNKKEEGINESVLKMKLISTKIIIIIVAFSLLFSLLTSISMLTLNVFGWNNSTTITKAYVWNTEPNVTHVTISPSPLTLTAGTTSTLNCTAHVWDYNGWNDVNVSKAVFYRVGTDYAAEDDNNNHYTIQDYATDCKCVQEGSSPTNASCTCSFDIWYYAYDGNWICNITVTDRGGEAIEREFYLNASNSASVTINKLIAIDVPEDIDYGNLSVTETSSEKVANIINFGNTEINVSVRAYGGTTDPSNPNNSALNCELGYIPLQYERYSLSSGTAFNIMTSVTNESQYIQGLKIPIRTNDTAYGDDLQPTYWKLNVPLSVGGICNGTLVFTAEEDSG